ncbi:uncharacterized protein LOC144100625 isoform X2 [Amblyomma americanum]
MQVIHVCLMLLGLFGADAADTAWHHGLEFPSKCYKQSLVSDKCGHAMKNSNAYEKLQEMHLRHRAERERFQSSLKACALDIMDAQEFQKMRKAIVCFKKVAAAKGAPSFRHQVQTMYDKYWVCVLTTFKNKPGNAVNLDTFVRRNR